MLKRKQTPAYLQYQDPYFRQQKKTYPWLKWLVYAVLLASSIFFTTAIYAQAHYSALVSTTPQVNQTCSGHLFVSSVSLNNRQPATFNDK